MINETMGNVFKMITKILTGQSLQTLKKSKENIDQRIERLRATLNGEDEWMLEKVHRPENTKKKFKCNCEEIKDGT